MTATSAKMAGTVALYTNVGTQAWIRFVAGSVSGTVGAADLATDDNVEVGFNASFPAGNGLTTRVLRVSNFGFTTSDIPAGSTINSIVVRAKTRTLTGNYTFKDSVAQLALVSAGTSADRVGSSLAGASNWTVDNAAGGGSYQSYSFTTGLPTDSQIRSSAFAFDFEGVATGTGTTIAGGVGIIDVVVNYTAPTLAIGNASHGHSASSPGIAPKSSLAPANAAHAQAATSPPLTPHDTLPVSSAAHAHAASSPNIVSNTLSPQSSGHAHLAGSPTIGWRGAIAAASAMHGHLASSAPIAVRYSLSISSSMHGHLATSPMIRRSIITPASRRFAIPASTRDLRRFNLGE